MNEPPLADTAFAIIERMIVLQQLPPGSLVSEKQLTELTGIGRTPVREALHRLARDRMVEIHPQRGVLVPASSIEAQFKLLELRRVLEPHAATLAAQRATVAQRERAHDLSTHATGDDPEEFQEFLHDTHELIVEATHNEFVRVAMTPLQGLSRRFWLAHLTEPAREISRAVALHTRILRAIAESDESGAAAASLALNDYLLDFAVATLPHGPSPSAGV